MGPAGRPLPYALQDDYELDRRWRTCRRSRSPTIELRRSCLPQYGGRIWSLRQLSTGRDLVYRNPVLSWANLGLTNAWFAGGVEWNLGSTGHSATTARPLFAAPVETASGPVLRLWEWERTRDLVFSVDLSLPSGSDFLYASVRVRNPDPWVKPLYWWTNVAVAETPGLRVLAPASQAWRNTYRGALVSVAVPQPDEDRSGRVLPARLRIRRTTSSRSSRSGASGSRPWAPTGRVWCTPRPPDCRGGSSSSGASAPAATGGRSG